MTEAIDLNIENNQELADYLVQKGYVEPNETLIISVLRGGVSNRAVWVARPNGDAWVIKQALPKLRVEADWFSDPVRIHREAMGMRWLAQFTPPRTIPELIFEDTDRHIVAMSAVPQPHENWKQMLLRGDLQDRHVRQFATILAGIHAQSVRQRDVVEPVFSDRQFFESLRVEPYYSYTASQQPQSAAFYERLIVDTHQNAYALVHGDYSPKNILVHKDQFVLLDHEVIHFGDPAFDIGFSMTHLLSKAYHVAEARQAFLDAAQSFWAVYRAGTVSLEDYEERAVCHVLGCLLARVDGRSPLEYLSEADRANQRHAVIRLMDAIPPTIPDLIDAFAEEIVH